MLAPHLYINRELSWLAFNERVLAEAMDRRNRLLERVKFLAIFASNLDEYFMVRVAGIKRQIASGVKRTTPDGRTPLEQIHVINDRLLPLLAQLHATYMGLMPELAEHGVYLLNYAQTSEQEQGYLAQYFQEQIFAVLTPLAVGPSHPFPYISSLSLSLGVLIEDPVNGSSFARVKVPHRLLERFVLLRPGCFVPLEQVIAAHLDTLFSGMTIQATCSFRITRNADLALQEDEAGDLLVTIEQELRRRRFGEVVRLEVSPDMSLDIRQTLMETLDLDPAFVYTTPGLMDLSSLFRMVALDLPELKDPPFVPRTPRRLLDEDRSIFEEIQRGDLLVHHPYESFEHTVEHFIQAACDDPQVLAIKQTLYRMGGGSNSKLIEALIEAAENGKQVAVLVELKARFDEANNITWARALEKAGVHIVYGSRDLSLKTHCKVALVIRREAGELKRYVHIGTGNYNAKTANLYTDVGLFTCDPAIGADATDLFNVLTGYSSFSAYRKLLVAPTTLRLRLKELILREIACHHSENPGHIMVKMNALIDPEMIDLLYQAAQKGVRIDLIVRGMCCLRPGVPQVSEGVRVVSLVGRFLEHSRILYFKNGGQPEVFIGSADWMQRNLDRRVEVMAPVEDPLIKTELTNFMHACLQDNRQAWLLQSDGTYQRPPTSPETELFSVQEYMLNPT